MDFRPPVIADTQPTDLVEPGYRTLHYPPVDAQSAAMACKTLSQDGLNSQGVQHPTMSPRVIGSVTLNPVWSAARPAPLPPTGGIAATKGSNWVTSWRLASVRMAAKGSPLASVIRWCLLPGLRRSVGLGPVFPPTANRSDGPAIQQGSRPINLVSRSQFGQQKFMKPLPNPSFLPVAKPTPAGHARAASHLQG